MRLVLSALGLAALFSMTPGCVDGPGLDAPESDAEEVAEAASPQLDPGYKSYTIKQSGVTVASAWAGTLSSGAVAEYWAARPAYSGPAARSFDGGHQSCASWKASVCNPVWANATYYRAEFTQRTLDCGLPPGPCSVLKGTVPFLDAGSYVTSDSGGSAFAWTYVSGECEYWAMHNTISMGTSYQDPLSPGFASHSAFLTEMCAKSPVPSTYFEATYHELTNACSSGIVC